MGKIYAIYASKLGLPFVCDRDRIVLRGGGRVSSINRTVLRNIGIYRCISEILRIIVEHIV